MEKQLRIVYGAFVIVLFAEILNLIFKIFTPYYFNLFILVFLALLTANLGWQIKIKKVWIVTFAILNLLLITLLTFVVWN